MARSLRDSRLETREARLRLKPRGKPYWRLIEPGLHLGYRRLGPFWDMVCAALCRRPGLQR